MSELPQEIVIEILTWLPIKSLARFRCVAKSWLNLFVTPYFVKHHTGHVFLNSHNLLIDDFYGTQIWYMEYDPIESKVAYDKPVYIEYPGYCILLNLKGSISWDVLMD